MNGFSVYLFVVLVYYLEVGDVGLGVVIGNTVFVNCTGDMTIVFFYSVIRIPAGFSFVRKVTIYFQTGTFVDYVLFKLQWNFIFRMDKDRFKSVGSFEDDLCTGVSKDSSKFLIETRNIGSDKKTFFLAYKLVSRCQELLVSFQIL